MPELPEVETIARQLREMIIGRRVAGFESFWHRVTEPVPAAHFATRLSGREITGVGRRGKFVVMELDGGEALIVSLRMTGKLLFREHDAPEDTFVRAVIGFADGTYLRFSDTRKFGRMAIVDLADLVENGDRPRAKAGTPLHSVLGIEPLTPGFTTRWLREFLQRRGRSAIKPCSVKASASAAPHAATTSTRVGVRDACSASSRSTAAPASRARAAAAPSCGLSSAAAGPFTARVARGRPSRAQNGAG
jgi:DNA-formamidopyrimidine glycosylase